ncbi:MAG: winged helix-turn-helix domain-containing protein [Gammaproteobacteria bacterium]|nr:winged helix-turn-helix domain-containing protein [Gammaproteobacteria bacterium]
MAEKIHTDEQYIMIVRNEVVITISEVAEKLNMSVRNTTKRLRKLADEGKLTEKRIGIKWHFSMPEDSK